MNYNHVNKDNKCSAGKEPADYERLQWTMNGYNGLWTEALFVEVHRASCRIAGKKRERQ